MSEVTHQFNLFGAEENKPRLGPMKKFISKERMLEVKALFDKGDTKATAVKLRELRYGLEDYLKRM